MRMRVIMIVLLMVFAGLGGALPLESQLPSLVLVDLSRNGTDGGFPR